MTEQRAGLFIAIEGGDGAGKTTLLHALAGWLVTQRGHTVVRVREPGGTLIGEDIRTLVLQSDRSEMTPEAEALLFIAARSCLAHSTIRPALAAGHIVLCDRYELSTIAYQGAGRGLSTSTLRTVSSWAANGLTPDLTILLDIDPIHARSRFRDGNRFDNETLAFRTRVRDGFLRHAVQDPSLTHGRSVILDASKPRETVLDNAKAVVEPLLAQHNLVAAAA